MRVLSMKNNILLIDDDVKVERFLSIFKKKTLRVKDNANEPPYLIRYSLFSCRWFAVKLHRILISDEDCMHDHPWSFISIVLSGGYIEHTPKGARLYGAGSILYRKAPAIHRLQIYQPATTLVITFKKFRRWGFYTSKGWVENDNYIRRGQTCE